MKARTIVFGALLCLGLAFAQTQGGSQSTSTSQSGSGSARASARGSASSGGSVSGGGTARGSGQNLHGDFFAVRYTFGPNIGRTARSTYQKHSQFLDRLEGAGILVLGGDLPSLPGEQYVIRARNEEEAREIIRNDPFANDESISVEILAYRINRPKARQDERDR